MTFFQQIFKTLWSVFDEAPDSPEAETAGYDPFHLAGVVIGFVFSIGILYWLLWALLVHEGGLFGKILPFAQVLFTGRTLRDFGYEGYPYEQGVFQGWIVNGTALVLFFGLICALWWVYHSIYPFEKKEGHSFHEIRHR
jgi:hypothetical protein